MTLPIGLRQRKLEPFDSGNWFPRERSRTPELDSCADVRSDSRDVCVQLYVEGSDTPHTARQDVCIRRSSYMEGLLRFKRTTNQEASVCLKGIAPGPAMALIKYFQLDSRDIKGLDTPDLEMLMDLFDLRELRQEELDDNLLRTCGYCKVPYRNKHNRPYSCRRYTKDARGLCSRCFLTGYACKCETIQCPHTEAEVDS